MAQEEKLKEAKRLYESANADQRYVLESLFPELKESEGEEIRKEIIAILKYKYEKFPKAPRYSNVPKWIDWLEKQGAHTALSKDEQNKLAKGVLRSCAFSFINYLDSHRYEGKMDVSSVECGDIENAFQNAMWDRLHRYYCKYIEKQGEQNPAWSEEDEHKLNYVITQLKAASNIIVDDEIDDSIAFVKSLKERVQPKQEWSDEDEKIIIELIGIFESAVDGGHVAFPYRLIKDYIRVLKSCLPQSTWKPSDDEMKALAEALSLANNCGEEYAFDLRTLQDQLKKLK